MRSGGCCSPAASTAAHAPTEPWNVPGRYGWVGGTGTAAYIIPSRDRLVVWLSQVELTGSGDFQAMAAVLTWAARRR